MKRTRRRLMPHYIITYTSSISGACEYSVIGRTMKECVSNLVNEAKEKGVTLSNITVKIKGQNPSQDFCDACLVNEAIFGFQKEFKKVKLCKHCV